MEVAMSRDDMDAQFHAKLQATKGVRWMCPECGPDEDGSANFYQTERTYVDSSDNELSVDSDGVMYCAYCGSAAYDMWSRRDDTTPRS